MSRARLKRSAGRDNGAIFELLIQALQEKIGCMVKEHERCAIIDVGSNWPRRLRMGAKLNSRFSKFNDRGRRQFFEHLSSALNSPHDQLVASWSNPLAGQPLE